VTKETRKADPQLFHDLVKKGKLPSLVKGCPPGQMPYTADCRDNNGSIIYFHSEMNPFNPYSEIVDKCQGRSTNDIKMRAYGYAERMDSGAFPKFGKPHIMTRDRWLDVQKLSGSRFVVADPGGNKNWFIKWYFCTKDGCAHVYREFPDLQRYGEWAVPSDKLDFKAGPAQRMEAGRGIEGYKQLILELEGWVRTPTGEWDGSHAEVIEERIMDARFGGDERYGEGTSIINLMEEEQVDSMGKIAGPRMWWNPARGNGSRGGLKPTEIGIQMLNEMMDYNEEQPVNAMNCPRWYVHEDCQQSIYAYQEYTALGTEKDALKDIIDPDRYLVSSDVSFIDKENLQCISGGSY